MFPYHTDVKLELPSRADSGIYGYSNEDGIFVKGIADVMNDVLVTGGAGFLGSHLVEELVKRGYAVTVLDNFSDAPRSNLVNVEGNFRLVEGDVRDESILGRIGTVDTIFHLAANANVPRSSKQPLFDASINVLGTINMLNLARDRGSRFVLASSGAVYGEPVRAPMSESHQLAPISPYGASKLSAESYVTVYEHMYDTSATIIRLFNMFGPRQRRFVVYDFARKILSPEDEVVILGNGAQKRTQLFVTDAVRAVLLVADVGTQKIYNVGACRQFTVVDIMQSMLRTFCKDKKLRTSQVSWDGDIQHLVPDVSRLQDLGFEEEVSFEQGLMQFKHWFMDSIRVESV